MPFDRAAWSTAGLLGAARVLAAYHRHRVLHLDRLGRLLAARRRVVLVGNHALDVVDPFLFLAAVLERYGRVPRFMAHQSWFALPGFRTFAERYRLVPSRSPEAAVAALKEDGFLMLFPGGASEAALRRYHDEPYRLKWENRLGFLRLALAGGAEIVFVAAVGNDEMYFQSRLPAPSALVSIASGGAGARYLGAPLRFGLLGPQVLPALFPLPVQLTHVVSQPIPLGDRAQALAEPAALDALHRKVWRSCQTFLDAAVRGRDRSADRADRVIRGGERALRLLGL